MKKTFPNIPRNGAALAAKLRRSEVMSDRRFKRNQESQDWLEEDSNVIHWDHEAACDSSSFEDKTSVLSEVTCYLCRNRLAKAQRPERS